MSDAARGSTQLIIDAGPQGIGRSGHGHADALSIQLSLARKPWLVDSGTGCYISRDGTRERFRGTAAHNTLRLDGQDQAIGQGPFAWTCLPSVTVERWIQAIDFNLFIGSHSGYMRLNDPVVHRRFIFHLLGDFWLVRDVAEGKQVHSLESLWHFHSAVVVTKSENTFLTSYSNTQPGPSVDHPRLTIVPLEDDAWTSGIITDQISPAYGRFEPAPVLRFSTQGTLPAEYAVVMKPQSRADAASVLTRTSGSSADGSATILCYDVKDGAHFAVFPAKSGNWTAGPWSSDASFLYYHVKQRRMTRFIVCNSSFAAVGSGHVFSHPKKLDWLEWHQSDLEGCVLTSEKNGVKSFWESVLTSSLL